VITKYAAERRQEIIRLLDSDPYVSVADLADRFRVSRAAVRRDLNELRGLGLLERTYGGALKPPVTAMALSLSEREVSHREEKARIGKAAATHVAPGETIFIDGGTTTPYMIPHLVSIPRLTVVTNAVNIFNALVGYDRFELILVGGALDASAMEFRGFLTTTAFEAYGIRWEKAFLAASAVAARTGMMDARLDAIPIKRKAIDLSRDVFVLADSSKIGAVGVGHIVPVGRIHRLITGTEAPSSEVARLRDLGVVVDLV
jgi:DeoR/GlpR family transcriptional regulator of sugar metabolism